MGLLIFGILLIVGGGIALGVLYREPKEFLNIVCKIWFTIVISLFMFWGFIMVMYNDIVFNKNIKTYNNISKITLSLISDMLLNISHFENDIELSRQVLNDNNDYDPWLLFRTIDVSNKNSLKVKLRENIKTGMYAKPYLTKGG